MGFKYQTVDTKSGVTGYIKVGDLSDSLILVTGYTGTLIHWPSDFVYELAKYYSVYLIDNRNVGRSISNNSETITGLAADIHDFIVAMELDKPILLGWSMGGVIVQYTIKEHQNLIKAGILLASMPNKYYLTKEFVNLKNPNNKLTKEEFRHKLYNLFFSQPYSEQFKERVASNALPIDNYPYRFTNTAKNLQDNAVKLWHDTQIPKWLSNCKTPILLIGACDDKVVNGDAIDAMYASFANCEKLIYQTGGHFLIQHNPVGVALDIIKFCKNCF